MDLEHTLHAALHADPADHACWLALADWLEEDDQQPRGALLRARLTLQDCSTEGRQEREQQIRQLLEAGVCPAVPLLTNTIGMPFALIPPGRFWMGSPDDEPGRHNDEDPRHAITLTRPYYLGLHPVTQSQFQQVMNFNPSHFRNGGDGAPLVRGMDTSQFPVEMVSWSDAVLFCAKLSALPEEKQAGRTYRLPSEAEWEYACRAGTTSAFAFGDSLNSDRANIDGNQPEGWAPRGPTLSRTCPVRSYFPNAFGLYDVHGNVWEWCSDWYDEHAYHLGRQGTDPTGPSSGLRRSLRGGSWFYGARLCRSAYRYRYEPEARHNDFGFRVALGARGEIAAGG